MGEWISANDRLPEHAGKAYLVACKTQFERSVFIAFRGYGDCKWYTYDLTKTKNRKNNMVNDVFKITHWQPLPEKPSEEETWIDTLMQKS